MQDSYLNYEHRVLYFNLIHKDTVEFVKPLKKATGFEKIRYLLQQNYEHVHNSGSDIHITNCFIITEY